MKEFKSFGALAKALKRNVNELKIGMATAMEISAIAVTGEAKSIIGHYQRDNMGGSEPWAELKDSTKADRLAKGYSENDPLLRSGELWESIQFEASGNEFIVGSDDPISLYQELGTPRIPPRPFLAPALYRNIPTIMHNIGEAIEKSLAGEI